MESSATNMGILLVVPVLLHSVQLGFTSSHHSNFTGGLVSEVDICGWVKLAMNLPAMTAGLV